MQIPRYVRRHSGADGDAPDAFLLNTADGSTTGTTLRYLLTLLELTDTTTTLTGPGSYNTEIRLIRE